MAGILTPGACNYDLVWKRGLCRYDQVKMRSLGWTLIQHDWCLYKRGLDIDTKGRSLEGMERAAICKQRREASDNNPPDPLISDFQPPELGESSFLSFRGPLACGWRRQWQPTPVLLPGKSHGRRSLVGCSPC